jgi:hypothetical protein
MAVAAPRYTPPKRYTYRQLEALWILAGGTRAVAPTAAQIALAESGGFPNAINHNTNGSIDRGLWQINSVHGALSTTDPLANARAAVKIANEARGFEPWVTYKTRAYEHVQISAAERKAGLVLDKGADPIGLVDTKLGQEVSGAIPGPLDVAKKAVATSWVGELLAGAGKLLVSAGLLLAGLFLVVYGIMAAVRPRERAFALPRIPV